MTERLLELLSEASTLLVECGWESQADWFRQIQSTLGTFPSGSAEFAAAMETLDKSLAGMGSFSDLPLRSKSQSLTDQELSSRQSKLVESIGAEIDRLLEKRGRKIQKDLDTWGGGDAQLWLFTCSHQHLEIRITKPGVKGNLHIRCGDVESINMNTRVFNSSWTVEWNGRLHILRETTRDFRVVAKDIATRENVRPVYVGTDWSASYGPVVEEP